MADTRKLILQYLKEHGAATVDELAGVLELTPVTVRHHLDILRSQELVDEPAVRHRTTPGRPQYTYRLTAKASDYFPKNYCELAGKLLEELKAGAAPEAANVFLLNVASRMALAAPTPDPAEPLTDRLERAVAYLNSQNYVANWEATPAGYLLHTCNCPYEALAEGHPELCSMDLGLVSRLLGIAPQRVSRVVDGGASCAYLIPAESGPGAN